MKILLYTDVHWSSTSSIIRSRGTRYSTRLENLLNSVNWAEQQAALHECECVMCLGDFFDKSNLNAEEITALQDITWANKNGENIPHFFIVGNHESDVASLNNSSTSALKKLDNFYIINEVFTFGEVNQPNCFICIPYMDDDNRPTIESLITDEIKQYTTYIFSHNDIKMRYGAYESTHGFDVEDIEKNCTLFLNGHLHNTDGNGFCKNGYNLGNLSGQNFSEDATQYSHGVWILDTITRSLEFIENPYAFNFYKVQVDNEEDLTNLDLFVINKNNAVVSVKCISHLVEQCRKMLQDKNNIVEFKLMSFEESTGAEQDMSQIELKTIDHLEQFNLFCLNKLGTSDIVKAEIGEVIK